jgi:hypothetical protein
MRSQGPTTKDNHSCIFNCKSRYKKPKKIKKKGLVTWLFGEFLAKKNASIDLAMLE